MNRGDIERLPVALKGSGDHPAPFGAFSPLRNPPPARKAA